MKNIQIPIIPGTNHLNNKKEEVKSAKIYHFQTGNEEIIFFS
jgi:hypothetical protein